MFLLSTFICVSVAEGTSTTLQSVRPKPALVDVTQEDSMTKYLMETSPNRPLTPHERNLLRTRIRSQQLNTSTHTILWYNLPDYVSIDEWNKRCKSCLFTNCKYTSDKAMLRTSSAIIFVTSTSGMGESPPLTAYERPTNQVWIFMSMESPVNHQWLSDFRSPHWRGTMNWSMTYRVDSEILNPYGFLWTRNVVLERNYSEIFRRKTKFAAWIVSHCDAESKRDKFISILQSYGLPIDIYGKCGSPLEKDPSDMINQSYKFYFSLENSLCEDYITEKFFRYFTLDTVLVVRGGADYGQLLPSDTFIDSSQFSGLSDLAKYLLIVNANEKLYTGYLKKKDRYRVDTAFTTTFNLPSCELCSKLNNKASNQRVYEDIVDFIYTGTCQAPSDVENASIVAILCISTLLLFLFFIICIFSQM